MARTGRFGRQPRSAPSLTNTLVAIAREFQNQRAQNIQDAWQKGGLFEGKKATDEVVLKFWRDKAKGVSKDDPLYDTYSNAVKQLEYSVAESKMTASYATKGKSDAQMVAFYLGWAKKVPKNSEFWRVLQRDAGQYMRNNRASNEAASRRAAEAKYQSQQSGTRESKEAAGEYVIDVFRRMAQSGNVNEGISPLIGASGSGSDLTDFDSNDPNSMLNLIAAITPGTTATNAYGDQYQTGKFVGNPDVLFYDDSKKPITGNDVLATLNKLDPKFVTGGQFNVDYVTDILDRQVQGLNERISRATKTGHMTDAVQLGKDKSYVAMVNREVAAYPIQKAYQEARADYDAIVSDKSASPQAVLNAWKRYSDELAGLEADPRIQTDDNLRGRIGAELRGDAGTPTLNESFTGLTNAQYDASSADDAKQNADHIEFLQTQVDEVNAGNAFWTFGEYSKDGMFTPKPGGKEIGAATPQAVEQGGGMNTEVAMVNDPRGGEPLQMLVTARPIYGVAHNPVTGEVITGTSREPIAYAYDFPQGAGMQTQYGFMTKDGYMKSADPPWGDGLEVTENSNGGGLTLNLDSLAERMYGEQFGAKDQVTGAYQKDATFTKPVELGNGFSVQRVEGTKVELTFDAQAGAWSTDTRKDLGSADPMTDFPSLTQALLMKDPEGFDILSNLDKNPRFKTQLETDVNMYGGNVRDPATGIWLPGPDADPAKLERATMQMNTAQTVKSFGNFVSSGLAGMWQRNTTGSPFKGKDDLNPMGKGYDAVEGISKLATDLVKGTPFEVLGNAFIPQTNNIKPMTFDGPKGMEVITPTKLTLPSYDVPTTKSVAGPAPSQTKQQPVPTQQGAQPPPAATAPRDWKKYL